MKRMDAQYLRDEFAVTYLTLISILQAVSLGLLATLVDRHLELDLLDVDNWLRIATSVVVAVLVWNEYRMGVAQFAWVPSLVDTVIPFTLGIVQFGLFRASVKGTDSHWFIAISCLYIAGVVGYENMYRSAKAEGDVNPDVLRAIGGWRKANPLLGLAGAGLFGSFAAITSSGRTVSWVRLTLLAATLVLTVAFLVRGEANWRRVVRLARLREASPRNAKGAKNGPRATASPPRDPWRHHSPPTKSTKEDRRPTSGPNGPQGLRSPVSDPAAPAAGEDSVVRFDAPDPQ
ncbi:MAG TPA: hypothetical protein VHR45_18360 [Thermoanaerobaculia bacterium]|nr:hypothetical protein [Thermoanaerobaculia bacterium]